MTVNDGYHWNGPLFQACDIVVQKVHGRSRHMAAFKTFFLEKKLLLEQEKDIFSCTFLLKVTVTSLPNVSIRHKGVRSREINSKRWPAILRKTLGSYSARSQTLDNFHIPTSEYRRCGFSYLLPILPQLNNVCKFPTFLMCPTKK